MEEEGFEEEVKLAQFMKDNYCRASVGKQVKETEPEKAAEIIHKIGLIYRRRSPDKISLIKCVGLLNAAIFRKPSHDSQIKADLVEVCKHILEQANANIRDADLVSKANTVKFKIQKLRKQVEALLRKTGNQNTSNNLESDYLRYSQVCKVKLIQHINKTIAVKYTQIMADLSKFCEDVMGKPPCEYAIVGMGSLARNEITPYSDFEHIILLFDAKDYESHLKYFRWYSVIFHVIILNVQESIIVSLNIKSLNSKEVGLGNWYFDAYTPRGVSFDGMMPHACKFPLGRFEKTKTKPFVTELIKPVSDMLKYLSSEADLKNGYHLADILTKTCFVFGNKAIFDQFMKGVKNYRDRKSKQERTEEIKQKVKDDLDNFSTRFRLAKLKTYDTINIKQLVYRSSTLFVTAMASVHNISENSCFDIIQKMANLNIISQVAKDKLSYAIAIACEMRLRVYTEKKSQCDNAIDLRGNFENINKFVDIVGTQNTINYFQIAYCLQCQVAKQLNFTKYHFYSNPQLINITIKLAFGMRFKLPYTLKSHFKITSNLNDFNFDVSIRQLETENNAFDYETNLNDSNLDEKLITYLGDQLFYANVYDEALEFNQQLLTLLKSDSSDESANENVASTYMKIGSCMQALQNPTRGVENYVKALKIYQATSQNLEKDENIAKMLTNIGLCLNDLNQYDDALNYFKQSLEIEKNISLDQQKR